MPEILLLAVASSFWPLLLAVVLIAFGSPRPKRLLGAFYAGGLLTTVVVGMIVVHLLQTSDFQIGSTHESHAALPLIIGVLAVLFGLVRLRRYREAGPQVVEPVVSDSPSKLAQWLDRSVPVIFLFGAVMNVVPGAFPVIALKDIADLNYSTAETFLVVLGFYLIMFAFLEIPLIMFFFDPERAADGTRRFNHWLRSNKSMIVIVCLLAAGTYLIVRGLFTLTG